MDSVKFILYIFDKHPMASYKMHCAREGALACALTSWHHHIKQGYEGKALQWKQDFRHRVMQAAF